MFGTAVFMFLITGIYGYYLIATGIRDLKSLPVKSTWKIFPMRVTLCGAVNLGCCNFNIHLLTTKHCDIGGWPSTVMVAM